MELDEDRYRRRVSTFKGVGMIRKNVFKNGLNEARRRCSFPEEGLTDEELSAFLKAGFRVHDKRRGVYVHI